MFCIIPAFILSPQLLNFLYSPQWLVLSFGLLITELYSPKITEIILKVLPVASRNFMVMECECGYFLNEPFRRIKTDTCCASQIQEFGQVFIILFLCNSSKLDMIQVVKTPSNSLHLGCILSPTLSSTVLCL